MPRHRMVSVPPREVRWLDMGRGWSPAFAPVVTDFLLSRAKPAR
jgi:hypothetical protein